MNVLGASPLGKAPPVPEHQTQLVMMDCALQRMPLQMDSEKPRSYLPKMPCQTPSYYPQVPPPNADSLEYFLRLSPETLFFTFYYMEVRHSAIFFAPTRSTIRIIYCFRAPVPNSSPPRLSKSSPGASTPSISCGSRGTKSPNRSPMTLNRFALLSSHCLHSFE